MHRNYISIAFAICCFNFSLSQELPNIMIFSKTEGFRHGSIEVGLESIKKLGKENGFLVRSTEVSEVLISNLKNCDAVIFLNTTGDVLNEEQQVKFKEFIKKGKGFVGIHAAADTEYEWPWYGKMVGAYFKSHPKQQTAIIDVINNRHLSTLFLDKTWRKFDEWYNFKEIQPSISILMKLDENSYNGGENGMNHPIAWFQQYEGGKIFYTGLGHTDESYFDIKFLKHILGGIEYVLGKG